MRVRHVEEEHVSHQVRIRFCSERRANRRLNIFLPPRRGHDATMGERSQNHQDDAREEEPAARLQDASQLAKKPRQILQYVRAARLIVSGQ
jgi:hypothetical protein